MMKIDRLNCHRFLYHWRMFIFLQIHNSSVSPTYFGNNNDNIISKGGLNHVISYIIDVLEKAEGGNMW